MTFSIVGRCAQTGMFGVAITTSSISVGSRCPHTRAGVGAVATQNITDPNLGTLVLDHMESGKDSKTAIDLVVNGRENIDFRQLTAIDKNGKTAQFTGSKILGTNAVSEKLNCIAAGNLLSHGGVADAMTEGFNFDKNAHLAERLLQGLEGGLSSGGEAGPVHSAALLVVDKAEFPLVDLRVDWEDDGVIIKLRNLWSAYEPQMLDYLNRALNPAIAPSYGVAGDL